MILVSQNLSRYGPLPSGSVVRINLAWVDDINSLNSILQTTENEVFLDLPIGRTKPPNNTYSMEQIKNLVEIHSQIKYLAISNVESSSPINKYLDIFGQMLTLVPKIETKKGIDNISEIVDALQEEKVLMLDHDDLFLDLSRNQIPPSMFFEYIDRLVDYCSKFSVSLLRMRGVIFSDKDKYYYK